MKVESAEDLGFWGSKEYIVLYLFAEGKPLDHLIPLILNVWPRYMCLSMNR